ncbi:MAG TPA: flagellar hook capping FlgD N-terminal domain-containing protein [Brevundimonas sp.]|jgi:flagellar basal-body rod modification protein FlgD|uniref:flagellar hook assembly protein FlgD n=1 Tax=Brevundimonas sp. TaxID=1871086 RepID=UPI002DEC5924|nr:flagellar hook capping FlgD N-terminal domain-containing protein [Brevundimonas sp.]
MVDAVTTASQAGGRIGASSALLSQNFETFLALLTAQLKNQDPLSPVDSNEFTGQLTQMAGVEQQLLTNDLLTAILQGQGGAGLTGATSYIGREATAVWSAVKATDGEATWSYELASDAASAKLQVLDASGRVVHEIDAPEKGVGVHDFTWTGGQDGQVYTLKVAATNTAGEAVQSQVLVRGRVTGVEMYDGQPYLTIGASILPLSAVIAVEEARAAVEEPEAEASILSALNPMKLFS